MRRWQFSIPFCIIMNVVTDMVFSFQLSFRSFRVFGWECESQNCPHRLLYPALHLNEIFGWLDTNCQRTGLLNSLGVEGLYGRVWSGVQYYTTFCHMFTTSLFKGNKSFSTKPPLLLTHQILSLHNIHLWSPIACQYPFLYLTVFAWTFSNKRQTLLNSASYTFCFF